MRELTRSPAIPLEAQRAVVAGALRIAVRADQRKWRVQVVPGAPLPQLLGTLELPAKPNVVRGADPAALWIGPREWLVLASEAQSERMLETLASLDSSACCLSEMTDALVTLEVSGPRAASVLADCPLDLEGEELAYGRCAQTAYAQVSVLIHRIATAQSWALHVDRSGARHVFDWIVGRGATEAHLFAPG